MTEKQKKNPQCRPRAKIAACLHLEALFRTISTRPGLSSGKRLSVGPAAVYRHVAGTFHFWMGRFQNRMSNFKMDLV